MIEKISKNRFEQYLSEQSPGKKYSDPKVQRAYDLIQDSSFKQNQSELLKHQDNAKGSKALHQQADDTLRMHRGTTYTSSGAKSESHFKNVFDSLGDKKKYKPAPQSFLNSIKKNPGKAGLIAGATLAGLTAVGAGVKSLTKESELALEKLAANALERHLMKQPPDKIYANPILDKAHALSQKSKEADKTAKFVKEFGGSAESANKYANMAREMFKRHRALLKSI